MRTHGPCLTVKSPPAGGGVALRLAPGGSLLVRAAAGGAAVGVRRFADQFRQLGAVAPGRSALLTVRPDLAPQPWHVQVRSSGPITVCGSG